jgi:hypothetical protein
MEHGLVLLLPNPEHDVEGSGRVDSAVVAAMAALSPELAWNYGPTEESWHETLVPLADRPSRVARAERWRQQRRRCLAQTSRHSLHPKRKHHGRARLFCSRAVCTEE